MTRKLNAPTRSPAFAPPRRGMVLYVVVVVVAMLALAGLSYVTVLSTENEAVRLHGDELQAECLVSSGVEAVKGFCDLSPDEQETLGGGDDNTELFQNVAVLDQAVDGRGGHFSVISPRIDNGEIVGIRFGVENESARLNLAMLTAWDEKNPGSGHESLMKLPGMTESIADAILDWIDADGTQRQFGAEAEYYSALNLPYGPRNTLPTSLEELLLVRDVTRELMFGSDSNFNYRVDPEETSSGRSGGLMLGGRAGAGMPWASLLTVFSAERNVNPDGQPKANLNSQDLRQLEQQLSGPLRREWINFIVAYRQFGPWNDDPPPDAAPPVAPSDIQVDLARAPKFEIESVLDLVGAYVAVEPPSGPGPIFVESPFSVDTAVMREYLPVLLDWTCVEDEPVVRGKINVDLAPRPVLAAVPGMDDALVERIVGGRASGGDFRDAVWRHPTWLLTEGVVDLEQMKQLLPYVTCGGDVYRAQVVGYFDAPGPSGRAEVVIDATRSPPRQIYWKDLRLLGPGYTARELAGETGGYGGVE